MSAIAAPTPTTTNAMNQTFVIPEQIRMIAVPSHPIAADGPMMASAMSQTFVTLELTSMIAAA